MKLVLNAFLLSVSLFSSYAFSAQKVDRYSTQITVAYINSQGEYLIQIEGFSSWLKLGKAGDPTADALYSTALAAKLSKQTNVWVRYYDSNDNSWPAVGIISIH